MVVAGTVVLTGAWESFRVSLKCVEAQEWGVLNKVTLNLGASLSCGRQNHGPL